MPTGDKYSRSFNRRTPRFRRNPNQVCDPIDQQSGIPTSPKFLVRQGFTGLVGDEGLWVDGRRAAGSYDQPGFVGPLEEPILGPFVQIGTGIPDEDATYAA